MSTSFQFQDKSELMRIDPCDLGNEFQLISFHVHGTNPEPPADIKLTLDSCLYIVTIDGRTNDGHRL
jgi:hypothetical protein